MEFFIAFFGIIFLFITWMRETISQSNREASDRERRGRSEELANWLSVPYEVVREVNAITGSPDRDKAKALVRENLDAILAANPYTNERCIDRYVNRLVRAKYGWLFLFESEIDTSGNPDTRAEVIEFMHQMEILLNQAGKNVEFCYVPGFGCDINDDSHLYKGKIVLKQYYSLFYKDAKYRRMW